jgi:hypothetical protein
VQNFLIELFGLPTIHAKFCDILNISYQPIQVLATSAAMDVEYAKFMRENYRVFCRS